MDSRFRGNDGVWNFFCFLLLQYKLTKRTTFIASVNIIDEFVGARINHTDIVIAPVGNKHALAGVVDANAFGRHAHINGSDVFWLAFI